MLKWKGVTENVSMHKCTATDLRECMFTASIIFLAKFTAVCYTIVNLDFFQLPCKELALNRPTPSTPHYLITPAKCLLLYNIKTPWVAWISSRQM